MAREKPLREITPAVGQVWQDWDHRSRVRELTFVVLEIVERPKPGVPFFKNPSRDVYAKVRWDHTGLETYIRTDRMYLHSTGYKYIGDRVLNR